MQTEEPKQFRLNRQVFIIAVVALLALAPPMAFVILSLRTTFGPKPAPPSAAAAETSAPLQKALEDIADKSLAPPSLDEASGSVVNLETNDPERELARVEALAKNFDAVALPAAREGGQIRLRVSLAENQSANFVQACLEKKSPPPVADNTDPARVLVEVVIKKNIAP